MLRESVIEIIADTIVNDYPEKDRDELIKELTTEDSLKTVELDSILYIKAIVQIEEKYGISFDADSLVYNESLTLTELCAYIKNLME